MLWNCVKCLKCCECSLHIKRNGLLKTIFLHDLMIFETSNMCPTTRTTLVFIGDGLGMSKVWLQPWCTTYGFIRSLRYGILDHRHISIILKRSLADVQRLRELRRMMKMMKMMKKPWCVESRNKQQWFFEPMAMAALPAQAVRPFTISLMLLQPSRLISSRPVMLSNHCSKADLQEYVGLEFHFGHWHHLNAYSTLLNMISSSSSHLPSLFGFEDVPGLSLNLQSRETQAFLASGTNLRETLTMIWTW